MIQKTLAEEAVLVGDSVYNEMIDLAQRFEGNADVERVKTTAETAHLRVKDEALKACTAADLASDLCSKAQNRSVRRLAGESVEKKLKLRLLPCWNHVWRYLKKLLQEMRWRRSLPSLSMIQS